MGTSSATLKLIVATFAEEGGAVRALATLTPGLGPENIGQAAVVSKTESGKVRFVESGDTTTGEGALEGAGIGAFAGLLGMIVTPVALLSLPIGAAVGALVGKLRDTGFADEDLKHLGADLDQGRSAVLLTVELDEVAKAERLLAEVDAANVVVKEIDSDLATALDAHAEAATAGEAPPPAP
ncbi:MAG: DUF1269 domain-containing protein [Acidimicrobiales bacterium]